MPLTKDGRWILVFLFLFALSFAVAAEVLEDPAEVVLKTVNAPSIKDAIDNFALRSLTWQLTKKAYLEALKNPAKIIYIYIPRRIIAASMCAINFSVLELRRKESLFQITDVETKDKTALVRARFIRPEGKYHDETFELVKEHGRWKILKVGGVPKI